AGRRAVEEWRLYEPEADLYVTPCIAIDLPAEDADELEVRLPLSSFLRWVNLIGWAGLAIGDMQLVAPGDETVLAAGLALEPGKTPRPMRHAVAALAAALLAAAGCGSDEPPRTPLQLRLAALCEQARLDVEALGPPPDAGAK